MNRSIIKDYLEPNLGQSKYTAQGLKYNCVKCDAGNKFNLEINLNSSSKNYLKFHCWSCHFKGTLAKLLKSYAITDSWKMIKGIYEEPSVLTISENKKEEKHLPVSIPAYLSEEIEDYLLSRGLTDELISKRKILYCYAKEDELKDNIIFPFYENGKLIGFSSQNFKTKKYRNHRDLNFIPYKEFINENYPVIITEGIYDALSVPNGIPLLGTKISEELYFFCKDKDVILSLDREVPYEEKLSLCKNLYFYGAKSVIIFDLKGYKDLNEFYLADKALLKETLKRMFEILINSNE